MYDDLPFRQMCYTKLNSADVGGGGETRLCLLIFLSSSVLLLPSLCVLVIVVVIYTYLFNLIYKYTFAFHHGFVSVNDLVRNNVLQSNKHIYIDRYLIILFVYIVL